MCITFLGALGVWITIKYQARLKILGYIVKKYFGINLLTLFCKLYHFIKETIYVSLLWKVLAYKKSKQIHALKVLFDWLLVNIKHPSLFNYKLWEKKVLYGWHLAEAGEEESQADWSNLCQKEGNCYIEFFIFRHRFCITIPKFLEIEESKMLLKKFENWERESKKF